MSTTQGSVIAFTPEGSKTSLQARVVYSVADRYVLALHRRAGDQHDSEMWHVPHGAFRVVRSVARRKAEAPPKPAPDPYPGAPAKPPPAPEPQ